MIKNKKLLIDADCPMCRVYGKGFEKLKLIDQNTVIPYQDSASEYCWSVNLDRARSEIAFADKQNGVTVYGIDAFIEIISQNQPRLNWFLNLRLVHWLLLKLYRFVSFNRKVIASSANPMTGISCKPDVHIGYRWSYILFTALFTGFILSIFNSSLMSALGLRYNPYLEYAICFGQIAWQGSIVTNLYRQKSLDYLGNMSTVSLLGALLLIPVILINGFLSLGAIYLIISFGLVVLIMFQAHVSRCKKLGISLSISASWIAYRLLILSLLIAFTL